ncbi:MAG: hypothetical protein ABR985_22620 [Methanotrichaceae archaeon]|jgi:hypothetical protein
MKDYEGRWPLVGEAEKAAVWVPEAENVCVMESSRSISISRKVTRNIAAN